MNILVINGSPKAKKSNTYRLTAAFLEGIRHAESEPEIRELHVSRMDIKSCLGCFACWNKTPGTCCIRDDMSEAIGNMLWADLIVWSFPLYYFSVPGGLKNLIDRQLPMVMPFMERDAQNGSHPTRYDVSGKRHVVISTCGFYTAEGNYDGVNAMFDHLCGAGQYTAIYCGQGELFRVKELSARTDEYLSHVCKVGAEFCSGGITNQTRDALNQLLYPREVFETMADASWGVEKTGEKSDETLVFTKQMAALYQKSAYPGTDIVLEMDYTDVNKRYQIVLDQNGSTVLTDNFRKPTTIIETPYSVWKAIASGEIRGEEALAQQKYRVKGDFSLMLKWDQYFGGTSDKKTPAPQPAQQSTNMNILLFPWIGFWVAAAIDSFYGALISLLITAFIPLLYHKNRKTVYDSVTTVLVSACVAGLLLGISQQWMLPLSYLCFGLMWTVSCFRKVPLTAHYSMNDYNGEEALSNPLFVKTNWILTLCWGILYLLTPIWTYFIMGSTISAWSGAINSVLPLLMGIFTGWFQKWYPAYVAAGH